MNTQLLSLCQQTRGKRSCITSASHQVTVAGDGYAALAAINRDQFDIVLMDLQMPHMSGFEATAAIRAREAQLSLPRVPIIAVDFGTATTFDIISAAGEYIGGVICPGIGISADALFQRAARLPRVDVRKPPSIIGQTTVTSMQAGLFFGYVSMVDGIVNRIRGELPEGAKAICIATGGMASVLSNETTTIQRVEPDLTLEGLRLIWARSGGTA